MTKNTAFWNQLLLRSDSIGDIKSGSPEAAEQLLAQLATIGEQFDRVFDPADQFEEYVAVAFCQAIQRALQPQRPAAVCKMSVAASAAPAAAPKPKKPQVKKAVAKSVTAPAVKPLPDRAGKASQRLTKKV
jgi:hypothetical protein